jgi:diguanylate cyclase (GGDEF)-like protein
MGITSYQMFLGFGGMTGLMMSAVLLVLHLSYPISVRGLFHWSIGIFCLALSSLIYIGRGTLPDFLSMFVANMVILFGFSQLYFGYEKFVDRNHPTFKKFIWLVMASEACLMLWFIYIQPSFKVRGVILASFILFINSSIFVLIYQNFKKTIGHYFIAIGVFCMFIGWLLRGFSVLIGRVTENFQTDFSSQIILFSIAPLMINMMALSAVIFASEKLRYELDYKNQFDSLTNCLTRVAFMKELEREIKRSGRQKSSFALLMLDLDHFKMVNDTHGHQHGDRVLADFSLRVGNVLRELDSFGRFGGDEFVILLPAADEESARIVIDRIRVAGMRTDKLSWQASVGVAIWSEGVSSQQLIESADRSLYQVKANKRGSRPDQSPSLLGQVA